MGFDARPLVPKWRGNIIRVHSIVRPVLANTVYGLHKDYPEAKRWVKVVKECVRSYETEYLPYEIVCKALDKQPARDWRDLVGLQPSCSYKKSSCIPEYVKALAWLLYQGKGTSNGYGGGWGNASQHELVGVHAHLDGIRLRYRTNSGSTSRQYVSSIQGLFCLSQVKFDMAVLTDIRVKENKALKHAVLEERVNITGRKFRDLMRAGKATDAASLRALLSKERLEAKQRLERERNKAARSAARNEKEKHEQKAGVAEEPVGVVS
jgi:hypothetical protein